MPSPANAVREPTAPAKPARVDAVDQVRALAIVALIISHFSPAIIERTQPPEFVVALAAFVGRFATPAFVAIFGITCGLVYLHRATQDYATVQRRMNRRALLLLGCVLLISTPDYVALAPADRTLKMMLLESYGILLFYAGAVFVIPAIMVAMRRRPLAVSLVVGGLLWGISYLLGFFLWPYDPGIGYGELARLYLVSGKYGFFALLGSAVLMIPVGAAIRKATRRGESALNQQLLYLGGAGLGLVVVAAAVGVSAGVPLSEMPYAPAGPPRLWFFALMTGATLALLLVLYVLRNQRLLKHQLRWLTALGASALPLYVGHKFVIPFAHGVHHMLPTLPDGAVLGLAGVMFTLFTAFLIFRRLNLSRKIAAPVSPAAPADVSGSPLAAAKPPGG